SDGFVFEAFIWDSTNGMRKLRDVLISQGANLAGWTLTQATGISADGSIIVGTGINPAGNMEAWLARLARPTQLTVPMDIKPGAFPNSINLKANGVLAVAVLTTPGFDARTVATADLSTIRFGDVGVAARVSPLRAALEDVDGDGDADLVLHFSVPEIKDAGALVAGSTAAELTGLTTAGQPVRGVDSVRIVSGGGGRPASTSPAGLGGAGGGRLAATGLAGLGGAGSGTAGPSRLTVPGGARPLREAAPPGPAGPTDLLPLLWLNGADWGRSPPAVGTPPPRANRPTGR